MARVEVLWRHRVNSDGLVHVRWSTDGGETWERATVTTKTVSGKLVISELRLPDPTTRSLRRVRLGALEQYVRQQLAPSGNVTIRGARAGAGAGGRGSRIILAKPETARYGDDFYRAFADAYRDATGRGLAPRPTLAADAGVSHAAIARWAKEARRRGYLKSAGVGKVSN
jgi:hypothetical protein